MTYVLLKYLTARMFVSGVISNGNWSPGWLPKMHGGMAM